MLFEQINKDYIAAMKSKEQLKSSTLSFLKAQIKNVMIDLKLKDIDDQQVITVIKKQAKQREDSIVQYEQGGRKDLADKEKAELQILKSYLPEEMTADQLRPIVEQTIKEIGAASVKDMGQVMKGVFGKVAGKADNKMVSQLVKEILAGS